MAPSAWKPALLIALSAAFAQIANAASVTSFEIITVYNVAGQAGCTLKVKLDGDSEEDEIGVDCASLLYNTDIGSIEHYNERTYQVSCNTDAGPSGSNECGERRRFCVKNVGCAYVEGSTVSKPCPSRKRQDLPGGCGYFTGSNLPQNLA